jgi:hypothetical protein
VKDTGSKVCILRGSTSRTSTAAAVYRDDFSNHGAMRFVYQYVMKRDICVSCRDDFSNHGAMRFVYQYVMKREICVSCRDDFSNHGAMRFVY